MKSLLFARPPALEEIELGRQFLADGGADALADYCLALLNANETVYVD